METMKRRNVAVIGAAGRVGLGLSLCIAEAGHYVWGVDKNEEAVNSVGQGIMPFLEDGAEPVLRRVLASGRLQMTTNLSVVEQCEVVIIILGTPIDENLNPVLLPLVRVIEDLAPFVRRNQLIVLRSTVSPNTTDNIRECLEQRTAMRVGEDLFLVFAPERVVQGKALEEIPRLPQLVGCYDRKSFRRAEEFFSTFVHNRCVRLTPVEAELGKLMCNMARYVTFALANEFYMIAGEYQANVHRIFDACSYQYPRFDLPTPGPNVGGPCLFKDGFFLTERFPFPELILMSFRINENMPVQIFKEIRRDNSIRKVCILGLTFKRDSDDTRYSLSFKLKKMLEGSGYEVAAVDPYVPTLNDFATVRDSHCVVLMTPHQQFANLASIRGMVGRDDCLYVDIWGFWDEMKAHSRNGYFYGWEAERIRPKIEPMPVEQGLTLVQRMAR